MADPVSVTGLVLQLGSVIKELYFYGKAVKDAQKDIIELCGELSSLKSVLADLDTQQSQFRADPIAPEVELSLANTKAIVDDLANKLRQKSAGSTKRVLQSLTWPLDQASVKATLARLERLKSTFLLKLMADSYSATQDLRTNVANLTTVIEQELAERKEERDTSSLDNIRKHLAPVSPQSEHRRAFQAWQGTSSGSWFLNGAFASWLLEESSTSPILWLIGRSGSGKTTLMSQAIESLRTLSLNDRNIKLGYHYCTHNNVDSQELPHILGSWLVQVAESDSSILSKYKRHLGSKVPTLELETSLAEVKGQVFLILDAINESFEYQKVANALERVSAQSSGVKILISTTHMFELPTKHIRVDMRPELMAEDIEIYIKRKIAEHRILQTVSESRILDAILSKADGMFRWVDCQLSALAVQRTPRLVLNALEKLPGSLDDTYAAILSRVQNADLDLVREALLWLCFSRRPLTLAELCETVVIEEGQDCIDEMCRLSPRVQLIEMCRGLVYHDLVTDVVTLSHSSVRTFLTSSNIKTSQCSVFALNESESQRMIVRKSLTYLSMENFTGWFRLSTVEISRWFADYPLLKYTANHWCLHARACQADLTESELGQIDEFLITHRTHGIKSLFTFWVRCLSPMGFDEDQPDAHEEYLDDADIKDFLEAAEPLYYMASSNFEAYVERMFQLKMINLHEPDAPWYIDKECGRMDSTALQVACHRGSARLVNTLLREGADKSWCLATALLRPDLELSQTLLQHGAALNEAECESFGLSLQPLDSLLGQTRDLQIEIDVEEIADAADDMPRHQVTVIFPNPPTAILFNSTRYDPWTLIKAVPQQVWSYRSRQHPNLRKDECGPLTRLVMASPDSAKIFPGHQYLQAQASLLRDPY